MCFVYTCWQSDINSEPIMSLTPHYPCIVLGAGPTGLLLASLLRSVLPGSMSLALINNKAIDLPPLPPQHEHKYKHPPKPDLRNYALSPASISLISRSLGAWPRMVANNKTSPYSRMQVWESSGTGIIHFDTSDYGSKDVAPLPYLGAVVEDKVLTTELAADVLSSDTHVIAPAAVKSISNSPDSTLTTITFDDETSVTTSLLFACDGANSFAKTSATQIETKSHPYERKALVATVKGERAK